MYLHSSARKGGLRAQLVASWFALCHVYDYNVGFTVLRDSAKKFNIQYIRMFEFTCTVIQDLDIIE